jgi:hypothetical protein
LQSIDAWPVSRCFNSCKPASQQGSKQASQEAELHAPSTGMPHAWCITPIAA